MSWRERYIGYYKRINVYDKDGDLKKVKVKCSIGIIPIALIAVVVWALLKNRS